MNNDLYRQKAEAKIEEYKAVLQQYKAKAKGQVADSRIDLSKQIDDLQSQLDEAKGNLLNLGEAAQDKSKEVLAGVSIAINNLKGSMQDLLGHNTDDDVSKH